MSSENSGKYCAICLQVIRCIEVCMGLLKSTVVYISDVNVSNEYILIISIKYR